MRKPREPADLNRSKGKSTEILAPALTLICCVLSGKIFPFSVFSSPKFMWLVPQIIRKPQVLSVHGCCGARRFLRRHPVPAFHQDAVCTGLSVLAFCCCLTDCHGLSSLKNTHVLLTVLWVRSQYVLAGSSAQGLRTESRCWLGL